MSGKPAEKIQWRAIPENCGGTIYFDSPPTGSPKATSNTRQIQHIGTWGCITCVGIYFKIDTNRAFCVHIHAQEKASNRISRVTDEEGRQLQQLTINKLRREAHEYNWQPANIDKSSLIVICPKQRHTTSGGWVDWSDRYAGWYLVEVLKEFLQLGQNFQAESRFSGFIVNYANPTEKHMIMYNHLRASVGRNRFPREEVGGYAEVEEKGKYRWYFTALGDVVQDAYARLLR